MSQSVCYSALIPTDWLYPPSLKAAAQIQKELAERVIVKDQLPAITTIGGMDVCNNLYDPKQMVYATVVVLDAQQLSLLETHNAALKQPFPYISGFLGFRETPALIKAIDHLPKLPDIILVDGHGISHPRGLGIASHIGVLLDRPTIGVAKSILVGKPEGELNPEAGSQVPLVWKDRQIATVLRTKNRCNPLIIAPGHRISHATAVELVLKYCRGYRLPEPTRFAHQMSNEYRKRFTPNKQESSDQSL